MRLALAWSAVALLYGGIGWAGIAIVLSNPPYAEVWLGLLASLLGLVTLAVLYVTDLD